MDPQIQGVPLLTVLFCFVFAQQSQLQLNARQLFKTHTTLSFCFVLRKQSRLHLSSAQQQIACLPAFLFVPGGGFIVKGAVLKSKQIAVSTQLCCSSG